MEGQFSKHLKPHLLEGILKTSRAKMRTHNVCVGGSALNRIRASSGHLLFWVLLLCKCLVSD